MKLKSLWYSFHPEQRWYLIGIIAAAVACLALGGVLGARLLAPVDEKPPAGMITQKEMAEATTTRTKQMSFRREFKKAAPPKGSFWLGPPPKNQLVFTSRTGREHGMMVAYHLKTQNLDVDPGTPYRAVITMKSTSRALSSMTKAASSLPRRQTSVGSAYMERSRALIPLPSMKKLVMVAVRPDLKSRGPQPELKAALDSLERR